MSPTENIDGMPPGVYPPPTIDEIPDYDIPLETERHQLQIELLVETLQPWLALRSQGYVGGGNVPVYFKVSQISDRDYRAPDFFAVLNAPKGERKAWLVWEEISRPDVIIELLSESTAEYDKTEKKHLYESWLRVTEYFWFDPFNPDDFVGFNLAFSDYEPIEPDAKGNLFSQQLGLNLVRWEGVYRGVSALWLRWATVDGILLPAEWKVVEFLEERAKNAELRVEKLEEKLRSLGVNPDEIV
jgi:Uma2 family endonuclease